MWTLNLESGHVFLNYIFSKGEKAGHHESCTLHYMNICRVLREKLCIIHSMRLLKRLWLKSVMMFSKNAILSAIANDKRGRKRKLKEKNSYRYFKRNTQLKSTHIFLTHLLRNIGPGINIQKASTSKWMNNWLLVWEWQDQ